MVNNIYLEIVPRPQHFPEVVGSEPESLCCKVCNTARRDAEIGDVGAFFAILLKA